jgi:hypothetical protein
MRWSGYLACLLPQTSCRSVGTDDTNSGRTYIGLIEIDAGKLKPSAVAAVRDHNQVAPILYGGMRCFETGRMRCRFPAKIRRLPRQDLLSFPQKFAGRFTLSFLFCSAKRSGRAAGAGP